MLQRLWFYHEQTDFYAPYPSDADKLVFAIFDRDFKSDRSDYCSAVARIPLPPASFDPCFHNALANTQRLCSQVQRF
jgi:hypothetical protein